MTKLANAENGVILLGAVGMFIGYTALPLPCPPLILLLPACLFWLARASLSGRQAFKRGWYAGLWGFSASLYWLTVPMTTVGQMPLVLAIPCVLLLGSFLGLYTGLACFCLRGLIRFFAGYRCGLLISGNSASSAASPAPSPPAPPLQTEGSSAKNLHDREFHETYGAETPLPGDHTPDSSPLKARSQYEKHLDGQDALTTKTFSARQAPPSQELPLPLPAGFWRRLLLLFLAGLCYGGIELISAYILTGFPWLSLPVALAQRPILIQPVNLVGAYGYSALLTFLALSPFMVKTKPGPWNHSGTWANWGILFCIAVLLGSLGLYSYHSVNRPVSDKDIQVGIVQSNIDQNQKWHPAMQTATVQKHLDLSLQAMKNSDRPLNLLVWAETAMPFFYQHDEPYRSQLHAFAKQHAINIAFGTLGYTYRPAQRAQQYNRLQLVSHEGRAAGHYDKEHLVPFGEYNPIPFTIGFLENILQGVDFSSGVNQPLLLLPNNGKPADSQAEYQSNLLTRDNEVKGLSLTGQDVANEHTDADGGDARVEPNRHNESTGQGGKNGQKNLQKPHESGQTPLAKNLVTPQQRFVEKFGADNAGQEPLARLGSLICYEVIFPGLAQNRVSQGANLLITISNDSWFGKTAAPQQHLNHAALRAVEQGRSIIRSTTSGYSALILPNGEVRHKSPLYTEAAYSFSAPLATRTTIYHTLHLGIDLFLLLGLCISIGFGLKFRNL